MSATDATDDYPADATTTGTVAVGGTTNGKMERDGDHDWFAVTLEAGKLYRLKLTGSHSGDGSFPGPRLVGVYDSEGNLLSGRIVANDSFSQVDVEPDEPGTYYVWAAARTHEFLGQHFDLLGTYTLAVTEVVDDHGQDIDTAGTAAVGVPTNGTIDYAGDRDWFAVTLTAGTAYRVDLETWGAGVWLAEGGDPREFQLPAYELLTPPRLHGIYDSEGNRIVDPSVYEFGVTSLFYDQTVFTPETDATYYVSAGGHNEDWSRTVGGYRLSVTEIVDDHSADTSTTGTVAVGGTATGTVEHGEDRDWFAVSLSADTTYRFRAIGAWDSDAETESLWYEKIFGLYDDTGESVDGLMGFESSWLGAREYFTPAEAGTYYVSVGTRFGHYGTYTLSVEEAALAM